MPHAKEKDITELFQIKRPEFDSVVVSHYLTPCLLHMEEKLNPDYPHGDDDGFDGRPVAEEVKR